MKSCIVRGLCASLLLLSGTACDDEKKTDGAVTPQQSAPIAVAVALQVVNEGATVTLNGSASHDPDGNISAYLWSQTAGPAVALAGATDAVATFVAPNVGEQTVLRFLLTVTDSTGLTGSDAAEVSVVDLNAAPVVTVPNHLVGDARTQIALTGSAVDPEGSALTYQWSEQGANPTATLTDATTLNATATLPDVDQPRELVFRLSATDSEGKVGYADVAVNVRPVAAKLRFGSVPGMALRNTPWGSFGVEVLNNANTRIVGGDASMLTVRLVAKAGGPTGSLVGTLSAAAVAGIASFKNVMFDTVTPDGNGVVLQALVDVPALTSPDSPQVEINWPTKLPGGVAAPAISVGATALVTVGANQDVIIGGSFAGAGVPFDLTGDTSDPTKVVSATGGFDGFVARYSGADGSLAWVRTFSGAGDAAVTGLAVASTGNIFVVVDYDGITDFPRDGQAALSTRDHGGTDVAVARLTSTGWTDWLQDVGGSGDDESVGLALDGSSPQNPIVAGTFAGQVNFNPDASGTAANSTAVDGRDTFALKLGAAAGAYSWHYVTGMAGDDAATSVWVRRGSAAATYLAGSVGGDAYFVQLSASGAPTAAGIRQLVGDGSVITGLTTDSAGTLYLAGSFNGTVDFDADATATHPLDAGANDALFLVAYAATGNLSYAAKIGGSGDVSPRKLALRDGTTDSLIIVGQFAGTVDFDPTIDEKLVTTGGEALFVLSLDLAAQFDWVGVVDPGAGFTADAMALTATSTRLGVVGWTQSGGAALTVDVDPNPVTTVPITVPANRQTLLITKMDDKGRVVP